MLLLTNEGGGHNTVKTKLVEEGIVEKRMLISQGELFSKKTCVPEGGCIAHCMQK